MRLHWLATKQKEGSWSKINTFERQKSYKAFFLEDICPCVTRNHHHLWCSFGSIADNRGWVFSLCKSKTLNSIFSSRRGSLGQMSEKSVWLWKAILTCVVNGHLGLSGSCVTLDRCLLSTLCVISVPWALKRPMYFLFCNPVFIDSCVCLCTLHIIIYS